MMRVLLVDDSKENIYMLEALLRGYGYEVAAAGDGIEALEKAGRQDFDMIISDILMPRMDGFQLCRAVKTDARLKKIAFVFYTATYTEPSDEEFALGLGAERFITKPAEPDVFMEIITAVLKSHETGSLRAAKSPAEDEGVYLKKYNQRLIRKLEDKMLELERVNAGLRESEEKYRDLIDNANDAVIVFEKTGRINFVNPRFGEMTGYSMAEAVQLHLNELIHPGDLDSCRERFAKRLARGKISRNYQVRLLGKAGQTIYVDNNAGTIEKEGRIIGILAIMRDITARRRAEEKIREYSRNLERMVEERTEELNRALTNTEQARDRIDAIIKSIADGLIVTDVGNRLVLMNRAAEEMLGVRFSDVVDRPIDFAIQEETLRERVKYILDKKITGYQFDFGLPGPDPGHPRTMRATTSVIEDKKGRQAGIVMIIHDVTRERETDKMKTDFISTTAHEFRTPLTSIRGFSEILLTRDDISREEQKKFLAYINKQAVTLTRIISDLLDISRIESGLGFSLNKESCNAGDTVKSMISHYQAISPGHRFDVVLPGESVELFVDREKIGQVLTNIIDNAINYSPQGGRIRVVGEIIGNDCRISVEDQGIGMSAEQVDKMFVKFYRADTSGSAPEGTGLGMTIVKYIVEAHGGRVWVESEAGKGTIVRFTLPIGSPRQSAPGDAG
ncbi:MAG: PAS domain S-box protein [Desulfobacterales bacterium]|nr:PAS domain S-box protein [Desulfobacterales bacterium]